jgi:hypothetical protein
LEDLKMAYRKFDDAPASADGAVRKLYKALPDDAIRRALQGVLNRVINGGAAGTATTSFEMGLGTGGTCGVKLSNSITCLINGRYGTIQTQDNVRLPTGIQGSGTWVKYLICGKHGTAATIVAGNEGSDSTSAKLPSLPDGYCPVGYLEYNTTSGAYNRFGGGTAGGYNVVSGNAAATCGTVVGWYNLVHMPYTE